MHSVMHAVCAVTPDKAVEDHLVISTHIIKLHQICLLVDKNDCDVAFDSNGRRDFKVYDRPFRPRLKCPT